MTWSVSALDVMETGASAREQPEALRLQFAPEWLDVAFEDEPLATPQWLDLADPVATPQWLDLADPDEPLATPEWAECTQVSGLDLYSEDEPLAVWPLPSGPPAEPVAPSLGCRVCGGILNCARPSLMNRLTTLFTTRQLLRCVDCGTRSWPPRATATNLSVQTQG